MCVESQWDKQGGDAEPRPWAARLGPCGLRLPRQGPLTWPRPRHQVCPRQLDFSRDCWPVPQQGWGTVLHPAMALPPDNGRRTGGVRCGESAAMGAAGWLECPAGSQLLSHQRREPAPFSKQPGGRGCTGARTSPVRPAASAPRAGTGQDPACSSQRPFSHSCPDRTLSPAPSAHGTELGAGGGAHTSCRMGTCPLPRTSF